MVRASSHQSRLHQRCRAALVRAFPPCAATARSERRLLEPRDQVQRQLCRRLAPVQLTPRLDQRTNVVDGDLPDSEAKLIHEPHNDSEQRLANLIVEAALGLSAFEQRRRLFSSQVLLHGRTVRDGSR